MSYAAVADAALSYADIFAPAVSFAAVFNPISYAVVVEGTPRIVASGEVEGQLYDETTGALLYDDITGAPLTW